MARYVALLRGINVGGKNLIRMDALRSCFEEEFEDVSTYIQSGNVLFSATGSATALTDRIERMLHSRFDHYTANVVLRSRSQMRTVVEKAPDGFGVDLDRYRCDVFFLKSPIRAANAIRSVETKEGVDEVWAGSGILYFQRLASRASSSRVNKLVMLPIYQSMTIRNWNTTKKLLDLLQSD